MGVADPVAIGFFFAFIALTLGITYWAARKTRTAEHFCAAGRSVTGLQNGLALAGDYMSAASFLGIAGLTLSGAAALSHDLWVRVVRKGDVPEREQLLVARLATILLGVLAIVLGVVFKGQNVAYMVGLVFAIAASANFPALVLSVFWRPFTTWGAQASMIAGTLSALVLIYLSPTIQVNVLGREEAWFPLRNPGLVTIPLAFLVGIAVSLPAPEWSADEAFGGLQRRLHLGAD